MPPVATKSKIGYRLYKGESRCDALCRVLYLKFLRIHLVQIIFKVWVICGQYIIDVPVSEIEPRCCFFPVESKTVSIPDRMSIKRCWLEEGRNLLPLECRPSAGRPFPYKPRKCCQLKNSSKLLMSSPEYLFLESECSFVKYVSSCPKTKYLYLQLPFSQNEGVPDNTCESVFFFSFW